MLTLSLHTTRDEDGSCLSKPNQLGINRGDFIVAVAVGAHTITSPCLFGDVLIRLFMPSKHSDFSTRGAWQKCCLL